MNNLSQQSGIDKMERKSEFQLNNSPSDYISAIKFPTTSNQLLLVSSWDCTVRLYDTDGNNLKFKWMNEEPVLDCFFMEPMHIAAGGFDGAIKIYDLNLGIEQIVGTHDGVIKCIEYAPKRNVVLSGSWDKTIKVWDLRDRGSVATYEQSNGKVYSMSVVDEKIAVATSGRKALIWDLRNMKKYLILHCLNHQPRCIRISPNKQCYVIGHIDGRVAVEYIKRDPEVRKCRARFKCHRMRMLNSEYIYTINSISFHNVYNTFATGGTNGFVNIWDGLNKKRLCQYQRYESSVASLAFSPDGKKLAVACSHLDYLSLLDTRNNYRPSISSIEVRHVNERKIKPVNSNEY